MKADEIDIRETQKIFVSPKGTHRIDNKLKINYQNNVSVINPLILDNYANDLSEFSNLNES